MTYLGLWSQASDRSRIYIQLDIPSHGVPIGVAPLPAER